MIGIIQRIMKIISEALNVCFLFVLVLLPFLILFPNREDKTIIDAKTTKRIPKVFQVSFALLTVNPFFVKESVA